ncbi:hypothetical protein Moror_3817 [Moniliophthora roreri MCA 2997]|nr:hypothetical protein Moror_3817 [Moniliophthora roreri MCA 2997]KAI3611485.1 hypothetical protein WG66_002160 [Moniliophthora roreri]
MLESPFLHRFDTNYAPSPKEVEEIKQILLEPEKALQVLEEEIIRLQAQRDELQSFVDNHRSLLSPIRRAPTDILREIFIRCLPDDHLPVRTLREAPLLLTGICRAWREAAISTPRLWNRIHISFPEPRSLPIGDHFRELMEARQRGLDSWLGRSGSLPLTFSFHARLQRRRRPRPESYDELKALYIDHTRHLFSYSPRWRSVSLNIPSFVRDSLQTYEFGQLNALKEFRSVSPNTFIVSRDPSATSVLMHPLDTILRRASSLHVLHLEESYAHLSIRWENVTDLVLSSCYGSDVAMSEVVRLLSNCTSLRQCTIRNIQFRITDQVTLGNLTATLPYLHTLNLQFFAMDVGGGNQGSVGVAPQPVCAVFDAISAPRLTHLSIHVAISSVRSLLLDTAPFLLFMERSGSLLSSLQLQLPVTSDGLIGLLRPIPQLSKFTLHCPSGQTPGVGLVDLIRALTPGLTNTDILCPLLEEITLTNCIPEDVEPLLALAEARCGPSHDQEVVRLKRMLVSVRTFLEEAEAISMKLQGFRDRGMSILLSSPPDRSRELYDDSPLRGHTGTHLEQALNWKQMLGDDVYLY